MSPESAARKVAELDKIVLAAVDACHPATDGERFCLYSVIEKAALDYAACQTVAPPSVCPTCSASMSLVYECDNGHEFQGPDVQRIEAETVGADITMCTADIGKMPVVNLGASPAVPTPRCPSDEKWLSLGQALTNLYICNREAPPRLQDRGAADFLKRELGQFFQPAPSPWISVKERLPEFEQYVLAWVPKYKAQWVYARQENVSADGWNWSDGEYFYSSDSEHVTHWQPLPAAPSPQGESK